MACRNPNSHSGGEAFATVGASDPSVEALLGDGCLQEAIRLLTSGWEAARSSGDPGSRAEACRRLADAYTQFGDGMSAWRFLQLATSAELEANHRRPAVEGLSASLLTLHSIAAGSRRSSARAVALAAAAEAREPAGNAAAVAQSARLALEVGKPRLARAGLRRALRSTPPRERRRRLELLLDLARAHFALREQQLGIACLRGVVKLASRHSLTAIERRARRWLSRRRGWPGTPIDPRCN
ncbi:MAG: hypothetical protein KF774_00740 [Planctomyces sp.]|nr:hypothetical protein [Planctomyces sp.]